jgi:hypothetical protein
MPPPLRGERTQWVAVDTHTNLDADFRNKICQKLPFANMEGLRR